MKISEYAVKNYQFTLVIFLMIVALGVTAISTMPRAEDPEIEAPLFPIVIVYPGTSPEDMEELVVDPLEKRISELENIKRVRSTINDGVAVIRVEYKYGSSVDDKYQELVREVSTMRNTLPADISSIEVNKANPTDVNILQVALVSENASREKLKFFAEALQDELEKVTALKNVDIFGLPDQKVRIELNLDKIAKMKLPLAVITGSIRSEMANIPGGSVDAGQKTFNIKTSGNYKSIDEIKNTIVWSVDSKNIVLKDIANIYFTYEEDKHITRLNGHRCILVAAAQKKGENITKTQSAFLPVLKKFKESLPSNIEMIDNFDQADNVTKRIGGLTTDFIIAILLVAITLLPLGSRAALIVMISIPLSLSIGIVLLNTFGYTLNQLSIVGLVVALGLLVDDSIVVVENIERWMLSGYSRMEATLKATGQIGLAVVGCTATLIIAFLPLIFLPEASGDFIRSLPMGVVLSVLASMLVSLTITPFLASKLLKEHVGHPDGNMFMRALKKVIQGSYSKLLDNALQYPKTTVLVALVIFIGSLQLFPVIGFSLFPPSEKPQFLINITTPPQSSLTYTNGITHQIEEELSQFKEIKYYTSNVGKGNPRIYYNEAQENERTNYAQLFIQLDEHTSPSGKTELIDKLQRKWSSYPGAKVEVKNFQQGPEVTAPIEVKVFGENLDTLRHLAANVEDMLNHVNGTLYVNNSVRNLKSDIKVAIHYDKASQLGISTIEIDRTVRLAVAGLNLGQFTDENNNEFDIEVTTPKKERSTLAAFDNLFVDNKQNTAIPLSQVASLQFESSASVINHQEKKRMVSVRSFVKKGFLADPLINEVIEKMDKMQLPQGYSYQMGGDVETRNDSFSGLGAIIIVTVFLFIAVLILEFGTFKSTLIVLSVIPLGVVGAVLALLFTGNPLSFVAIIGLIALAGIEVKNTILLVDFTNQLRKEGKTLEGAIREAGEVRFLPIILTSFTAIGGLIPIAISTNPLISPLAIVLIGGLISSTLLSRIVTPVVYKLIPPSI